MKAKKIKVGVYYRMRDDQMAVVLEKGVVTTAFAHRGIKVCNKGGIRERIVHPREIIEPWADHEARNDAWRQRDEADIAYRAAVDPLLPALEAALGKVVGGEWSYDVCRLSRVSIELLTPNAVAVLTEALERMVEES